MSWNRESWYAHCDNLLHTRSGFILAGQLIAVGFSAHAASENTVGPAIVAVLGILLCVVWWALNCTLGLKLRAMFKTYGDSDEVIQEWNSFHEKWWLSWCPRSLTLLIWWLPGLFILAWTSILLVALT